MLSEVDCQVYIVRRCWPVLRVLKTPALKSLQVKGSIHEPLQLSQVGELVTCGRGCSRITANIPGRCF